MQDDSDKYPYPTLIHATLERSSSDKNCRCPLYQEMLELFKKYYEMNRKRHNFTKMPLTFDLFSNTVKLSVIGVEFKDKLSGNLQKHDVALPPLLGHS